MVQKRRQAVASLLARDTSRCLTTLLQLELGPADPAVQAPFDVFESWFDLLAQERTHQRLGSTWNNAVRRLKDRPPDKRWRGIIGITTATVATLLDIGWNPVGPADWISDEGVEYRADLPSLLRAEADWSDLKAALHESLLRKLWGKRRSRIVATGLKTCQTSTARGPPSAAPAVAGTTSGQRP